MFKSLSISRFRGISDLELEGLTQINLLLGKNNAGKTTAMEALFLLCGATTPSLPMTACHLRGQRVFGSHPDSSWRSLFWQMDPRCPLSISAEYDDEPHPRRLEISATMVSRDLQGLEDIGVASTSDDQLIEGLRLHYTNGYDDEFITKARYEAERQSIDAATQERTDYVRGTFLTARSYSTMERDAQQFSHLLRIKQEQEIVDALAVIEPRVQRVEVLSESGRPAVYVDLGLPSLIPLAACGEGFVRFFSIVVEVTGCRRGVLLVDEIDNGLHHSVMSKLWMLLANLCQKHQVQLVATTHNEELVTSAVEGLGEAVDDLTVFRLDRHEDSHTAMRYDSEMLRSATLENIEIRG